MRSLLPASASLCALLILAGCGQRRPPAEAPVWRPAVEALLRYDTNHDGQVTRGELEAGIRKDFAAADTNHNGLLDGEEIMAVNQARWAKDAASATPLVDWNQDGFVDFREFASAPQSLFDQLDTNGDGVLSAQELKPPKRRRLRENPRNTGGLDRGRQGREPPGGDGDGD